MSSRCDGLGWSTNYDLQRKYDELKYDLANVQNEFSHLKGRYSELTLKNQTIEEERREWLKLMRETDKLQRKYKKLKKKYRQLKEEVRYVPGHEGAIEAQQHFETF